MDGRDIEKEISKRTEEVITGGDQKRNRKEKEAIKKWTSCCTDQRAEALFALIVARLNNPHELYCMFSV